MVTITVKITGQDFGKWAEQYIKDSMGKMKQATPALAQRLEAHAKANAPWTDITGNARRGLNSKYEFNNNSLTLSLGHGVDYGIHLENMQSGRFAIVGPTMRTLLPVIVDTYVGAWS